MVLTVVAKTSYRLLPGESELLDPAHPVRSVDRYGSESSSRALFAPSDLVPHKARADVLLVGSAFSKHGPVPMLKARLAFGAIDKTIEVFGDRAFSQDGSLRDPVKFSKMSLGWERASFGAEGFNPAGVRSDAVDSLGRSPLPNLQPPGLFVTDKTSAIAPIGFGPIAPWWPARRTLWTAPGEPLVERFRDEPLVDLVDKSFFNAAPLDQQLEKLGLRDRLLLENMHPDHAVLMTTLPNVKVRAVIEGQSPAELAIVPDTLFIDTDRQIASLTWRGGIELSEPDPKLLIRVFAEQDGRALEPALYDEETSDELPPETARQLGERPLKRQPSMTLPFQKQLAALPMREPKPPSTGAFAPGAAPPAPRGNGPSWLAPPSPRSEAPPMPAAPPPPPVPALPIPASAPPPPRMAAPASVPAPANIPNPPPAIFAPVPVRPAIVPTHEAVVGAEAASNAAAKKAQAVTAEESAPLRAGSPGSAPVDLVWIDPKGVRRVRSYFRSLLAELEFEEFDSKHELSSDDPDLDKARNELSCVLSREPANDPAVARRVLDEAIDEQGRFTPPLAVFEADMKMSFAELPRLESLLGLVAPLAVNDKKMKDLCDQAEAAMKRPMAGASPQLSRCATQIREHYATTYGRSPPINLEAELDRVAMENRAYDVRSVLGGKHLRGALGLGPSAVTLYLAQEAAEHLPLFEVFRARVVAEVHIRQDRSEASSLALRIVALARVLTKEDGIRS